MVKKIKISKREQKETLQKLSQLGNEKVCPVAIFIKDEKILCGLRHYTPDKWKIISLWTCPGGRCDKGETVEKTLRREVKEEIGITNFKVLNYIGEVPGAKKGDVCIIFLCETSQSPKLMEPKKFSEWKWFPKNDLPKNYINDDIKKIIISLKNLN